MVSDHQIIQIIDIINGFRSSAGTGPPTHERDLQATSDLTPSATLADCLGQSIVRTEERKLMSQQAEAHATRQLVAAQQTQTEASDSASDQVCCHFAAKLDASLHAAVMQFPAHTILRFGIFLLKSCR